MTPRETLDEAIDRVASQLTAVDARAHRIVPVWRAPRTSSWFDWRLAAVGAAAIVAAVLVTTWRGGEQPGEVPRLKSIAGRALTSYPTVPEASRPVVTDTVAMVVAARMPNVRAAVVRSEVREDDRWGIPSIAEPAALRIDAVAVAAIGAPSGGIDALTMAPLAIDPLAQPR